MKEKKKQEEMSFMFINNAIFRNGIIQGNVWRCNNVHTNISVITIFRADSLFFSLSVSFIFLSSDPLKRVARFKQRRRWRLRTRITEIEISVIHFHYCRVCADIYYS